MCSHRCVFFYSTLFDTLFLSSLRSAAANGHKANKREAIVSKKQSGANLKKAYLEGESGLCALSLKNLKQKQADMEFYSHMSLLFISIILISFLRLRNERLLQLLFPLPRQFFPRAPLASLRFFQRVSCERHPSSS